MLRVVSGIAILDLAGPLNIGRPTEVLRDAIRAALDQGHSRLILNLAAVPHTDSAGLGELVSSFSAVVRRGGAMKIACASPRVLDMITITRLDMLFDLCATEAEALAGFSQSQGRKVPEGFL